MNYHEYINSPAWFERRRVHFRANDANTRCFVCNWHGKSSLHVHHITYDRLGSEAPEDLVSLCRNCHAVVHDMVRLGSRDLKDAHINLRDSVASGGTVGTPITQIGKRYARVKKPRGRRAAVSSKRLKRKSVSLRGHITCVKSLLNPRAQKEAEELYSALEKFEKLL